jgi:hypothetical protein
VRKKPEPSPEVLDGPIDLAARIGNHGLRRPLPAAPEPIRRVDGPIESDRSARGRLLQIGANEAPASPPEQPREPERWAATFAARPMMIGVEEAFAKLPAPVPPMIDDEPAAGEGASAGPAILTPREAPLMGEMDLVVTPLATPDDWHHFELALRRVPGVGPLRIEYYRAGILKLRLQWTGAQRFAHAVANVPGYRVGILGEDRSTVQIRVARSR